MPRAQGLLGLGKRPAPLGDLTGRIGQRIFLPWPGTCAS
jgi:hypothetical protein